MRKRKIDKFLENTIRLKKLTSNNQLPKKRDQQHKKFYLLVKPVSLNILLAETKEILVKILQLLLDIARFAYNIVRQVILPTKSRKGNILTSLFVFFTGVIKKVSDFEHRSFRMTAVFNQKYIRKGFLLITASLLLLTSFEWINNENNTSKETNGRISSSQQIFDKRTLSKSAFVLPATEDSHCRTSGMFFYRFQVSPICNKIYLLTRSLLI